MAFMGKSKKKRVDLCICIMDLFRCIPETNTTLEINHTPIKIKKKEVTATFRYGGSLDSKDLKFFSVVYIRLARNLHDQSTTP